MATSSSRLFGWFSSPSSVCGLAQSGIASDLGERHGYATPGPTLFRIIVAVYAVAMSIFLYWVASVLVRLDCSCLDKKIKRL